MKTTDTVLDRIIAAKRVSLQPRQQVLPQAELERQLAKVPLFAGLGFFEALKADQPTPKIIAEVKQASPSTGVLREPFDLAEVNSAYQAADNVVAISVITESDHFQGSEAMLQYFADHNAQHKPLLRKDFLFEPYQIIETKVLGAQAYLLVASLFERQELQILIELGQSLGLEPLVEVHNQAELDMVLQTTARCIGVNARDLKTFAVDPARLSLLSQLDDSYARVAESGIKTTESLHHTSSFSDAALIGSYFMTAPDIAVAITELVGASA